jgi:NAD-dependent dihydropyrimidine dehydrogenase PreA subunit
MSSREMVWIDAQRCIGCGRCVEVCPVGAIALANDKAHIGRDLCTGCMACIDACPEGAVQPVVEGELIPVPEWPAPTVRRLSPLAETAGTAVVATGVGLLAKAAGALTQALGRWLARSSTGTRPLAANASPAVEGRGGTGRGRRGRHRRRGRWGK